MDKEIISPYSYPGLKRELLNKKKYPYLFSPMELRLTKEEVIEVIAKESGLSIEMILSRVRKTPYVDARNLYCKILKFSFKYNLVQIAKEMGKDHTTIIWNIKKFEDRYKIEDDYRNMSDRVFKKIGVKLK
jgi:chromosomal replication initiation ATPase DnaA